MSTHEIVKVTYNEAHDEVRYYSGAMTYQERLIQGKWIGSQWSPSGRMTLDSEVLLQHLGEPGWPPLMMSNYPIEAFSLEIDGQNLCSHWTVESITHEQSAADKCHVYVTMKHEIRPVKVVVHTKLDGTPFMERWLEIINISEKPAAIGRANSFSGLLWRVNNHEDLMPEGRSTVFSLGHFPDWFNFHEGNFLWTDLESGTFSIDARIGRSGFTSPFFVARNEASGGLFMGALAWSDNWEMKFKVWQNPYLGESRDFACLFLEAGPIGAAPLRMIAPSETVRTPSMHIGNLFCNFDLAVQAWHRHLRKSVIPAQPHDKPLIQTNHWDYTDYKMSVAKMLPTIDVAAEIGSEVFVVDAGWYGGKDQKTWDVCVGDWKEGEWMQAGGGLKTIIQRVHEKGMLFGIWMEPERIGQNSQIYSEHPEWVFKRDGQEVGGVLNLCIPEVARWMEEQIVGLIETYKPDLFRLDYNANVWAGGQNIVEGYIEHTAWRYYEALWGIWERIATRYPKMILENCASGGGRCDLGMMSRFHQTWISDEGRLPRSLQILNGMTMPLPPEVTNRFSHASFPSIEGMKRGDLDTHIRMTLFGQMMINGIAPSLDKASPYAMEKAKHYIKLYKDFVRPMYPNCLVYHHTPSLEPWKKQRWCVLEYTAENRSKGMAGVFTIKQPENPEYLLRLRGLDRGRCYRVHFENSGQSAIYDAARLMDEGVLIRLENSIASELVTYEAQ